jgi:hypothetical protein
LLDLAESLAEKTGASNLQEYCSRLLAQAIETECVRLKVEEFEAKRGPLEGLREIANDPDYLAEWQTRSDTKQDHSQSVGVHHDQIGSSLPGPSESVTAEIVFPEAEIQSEEPHTEAGALEAPGVERRDDAPSVRGPSISVSQPIATLKPRVLLMSDRSAMEVLARHVGWSGDDWGFLPCLRRGQPPPPARVLELTRALVQIEEELRSADVIDRKMAHALHRLALEAQVMLTDAWPGVFDEPAIRAIRAVQEGVERILSGEDIRYYPTHGQPGSE